MALCDCAAEQLCERCFGRELAAKSGQAAALGQVWAESICRGELRAIETWPELAPRTLAMARRKVRQLGQDPRLLEQLALACSRGAATWWAGRPARYRST